MRDLILALDQGTTSTRAIAFRGPQLQPVAMARRDLPQHYPAPGWVEHDPEDIASHAAEVLVEAVLLSGAGPGDVAGIGIANQRETTIVWDRATGRPIHRAIVWQDRRTAGACAALRPHEAMVASRTGLVIDPYFSATKIAWLLDHVPGARLRAERGELAFGTVDAFLLWRLTGGQVHATDATNASRTMLYDIHRGCWDAALLDLFRVPAALLPEVRDCSGLFGMTGVLGAPVPVLGIAGDQQAATIGQACFRPGMAKATYGTGAFVLLNTGADPVASQHRLLTTVAYQLDGVRTYALEGSIFVAGAAVQWLRDGMGLLAEAADAGRLAAQADPQQAVYLVPAFTGLGAPHWDPNARGALFGLTRGTGPAEFARAALESVAYQTRDLIGAMQAGWQAPSGMAQPGMAQPGMAQPGMAQPGTVLRVDGGMVVSDWTMQFLADMLGAPVDRPAVTETTALGAAYLAGLAAGLCPPPAQFAGQWRMGRRFAPGMDAGARDRRYAGWLDAVRRTLSRATG